MNKTKVLDSYDIKAISKSYKWENNRTTFPPNWWTEIMIEFLHKGIKSSIIEKDYRNTLENASKTNKTSNEMYINTLLRRFMIEPNSQGKLKDISYTGAKRIITNYMKRVVEDAKKEFKLTKSMLNKIREV